MEHQIKPCTCGSQPKHDTVDTYSSSITCESCGEFVLVHSDYIDVIQLWNNGTRGEQEPDFQGW